MSCHISPNAFYCLLSEQTCNPRKTITDEVNKTQIVGLTNKTLGAGDYRFEALQRLYECMFVTFVRRLIELIPIMVLK